MILCSRYNIIGFDWQLDVYHPAMYRAYIRKNDMDEPPPLEDGSSYGGKDYKKHRKGRDGKEESKDDDENNLEEKFYKYGVRPEWLQMQRIINHRWGTPGAPNDKLVGVQLQ